LSRISTPSDLCENIWKKLTILNRLSAFNKRKYFTKMTSSMSSVPPIFESFLSYSAG
jgi:hypothetical protein